MHRPVTAQTDFIRHFRVNPAFIILIKYGNSNKAIISNLQSSYQKFIIRLFDCNQTHYYSLFILVIYRIRHCEICPDIYTY